MTQYKLFGVTINAALKWYDHVNAITSKAAKRLWFLKKLKRAGVAKQDLAYFFQAVVRPLTSPGVRVPGLAHGSA